FVERMLSGGNGGIDVLRRLVGNGCQFLTRPRIVRLERFAVRRGRFLAANPRPLKLAVQELINLRKQFACCRRHVTPRGMSARNRSSSTYRNALGQPCECLVGSVL